MYKYHIQLRFDLIFYISTCDQETYPIRSCFLHIIQGKVKIVYYIEDIPCCNITGVIKIGSSVTSVVEF